MQPKNKSIFCAPITFLQYFHNKQQGGGLWTSHTGEHNTTLSCSMFLMYCEKIISTQNMLLSFRSHCLYTKGGAVSQAKLLIGPAIPTAYNQVVRIPGSLKSLAWLIVLLHLVCYNMSVHFAPLQNSSTNYML